jgi:hypothetical protein
MPVRSLLACTLRAARVTTPSTTGTRKTVAARRNARSVSSRVKRSAALELTEKTHPP